MLKTLNSDFLDLEDTLTNCEVHTQNIRTAVLKYGPNEIKTVRKAKVRIFSVWNEQLVNKSFIV